MEQTIISKQEAKLLGYKFYFTGKPCKHGHVCNRYVISNTCRECNRMKSRNNNTYKCRVEYYRQYHIKNKERIKKRNEEFLIKNPEMRKIRSKKIAANILHRHRTDPLFRLHRNFSRAIHGILRGGKSFRSWTTFVKFTPHELKIHLESQFHKDENINWENYGTYWDVDHIKPISKCSSFEEAWELSNLQPLESRENRFVKKDKYHSNESV